MYKPSLKFDRSPAERKDPFLYWQREDLPFFANGACHILAFMFMQLHSDENFEVVYIKPHGDFAGSHVYVTNGEWAFDANGWTVETDLRQISDDAYTSRYPGWTYDRLVLAKHTWWIGDFEKFCLDNYHRTPQYYAFLPWDRAYKYIQTFPPTPPAADTID